MSGSASKASPNQDAYAWIGASGGAWTTASNWRDTTAGTLPAPFIPGLGTPVAIAGPTGSTFGVITAGGTAASITVTGNESFSGRYTAGTLTVGQRLEQAFSEPIYVAGAVSVAAGSRLDLGDLTVVSGKVLLAGIGATLTASGAVALGSAPMAVGFIYDNGASGNLGVGNGSTLAIGGPLAVNQGTLAITGAVASVAGAVSHGSGGAFRTTGVITVSAGGTLSLGAGLSEVYGGVVVSGTGSRLDVAGNFEANAPAYYAAAPVGYVSLAATAGGRAQVGGISVQGVATNGVVTASRITVDLTGAIEVGNQGRFTAGAITVDGGRTLSAGSDTVLTGAIVNYGTILAAGGVLTLAGNLSGSGVVQLGRNATLVLNGNAAAEGTISFGPGSAALVIGASGGSTYTVGATISGFATGDSILIWARRPTPPPTLPVRTAWVRSACSAAPSG